GGAPVGPVAVDAVDAVAVGVVHIVEADVGQRGAGGERHGKSPSAQVRVHVVNGVLIAPGPVAKIAGAGGDDEEPIARDLNTAFGDGGIGGVPGGDRGLLGDCGTGEDQVVGRADDRDGAGPVGGVVVAVAGRGVVGSDGVDLDEVG